MARLRLALAGVGQKCLEVEPPSGRLRLARLPHFVHYFILPHRVIFPSILRECKLRAKFRMVAMNSSPEGAPFVLPLAKRAAFLDALCAGDAALRALFDAFVGAHEPPDTLLATRVEAAEAKEKAERKQP